MYKENIECALGVLDELFDELAHLRRTKMDNGKGGCVEFSINPVDGSREIITPKKTCSCKCNCNRDIDADNFVDTPKPCPGPAYRELLFNGSILDDIDQVIFNDPATIVTFKDGTKVCVKTCEKDTFCKETGLVYAIIKRLYANDVDENGYLKSTGLGERINQIVENAFDQKKAEADRRAKAKAKAKAKEAKAKADCEQTCCENCERNAPIV